MWTDTKNKKEFWQHMKSWWTICMDIVTLFPVSSLLQPEYSHYLEHTPKHSEQSTLWAYGPTIPRVSDFFEDLAYNLMLLRLLATTDKYFHALYFSENLLKSGHLPPWFIFSRPRHS